MTPENKNFNEIQNARSQKNSRRIIQLEMGTLTIISAGLTKLALTAASRPYAETEFILPCSLAIGGAGTIVGGIGTVYEQLKINRINKIIKNSEKESSIK